MVSIPNFSPDKSKEFIKHINSPFVNLLFQRDIERLPISDLAFLDQQEHLLSEDEFTNLFARQLDTGGWLSLSEDRVYNPMYQSTIWHLIYLGYLGLNGTVIPHLTKAVNYCFRNFYDQDEQIFPSVNRRYSGFLQCVNAMLLRSLLKMGFADQEEVHEASLAHLDRIHGEEGYCRYKKGGFRCGWGLIKDLLFLNEFPSSWRNKKFSESVKTSQDYLLSYNLSEAKLPRAKLQISRHWLTYAYFRSYHSDIFEAAEALVLTGVKNHRELTKTLKVIGSHCLNRATWKSEYYQPKWPFKLERRAPSPWLTLRGLRITGAKSS
ncbi:MAG: hypothetical protein ACE5R6_15210 [Candidatus Heimdallarchaeota archaeon]